MEGAVRRWIAGLGADLVLITGPPFAPMGWWIAVIRASGAAPDAVVPAFRTHPGWSGAPRIPPCWPGNS